MKILPTPSLDRVKKLSGFASAILGGSSILLLASIPPSHAALAPYCVFTKDHKQGFLWREDAVTVVNGCTEAVRVLVVVEWKPNFSCKTLSPGEAHRWKWSTGIFSRVEKC
jgi:hypothetical protein